MLSYEPELTPFIEPQEHVNGRVIVGRADAGDKAPLAYAQFDIHPTSNQPPDPIRPSNFDDYITDTGVFAQGIPGARVSLAAYINPYAKHGQRDFYNENIQLPGGKPHVLIDNRGRVLDARTQAPGQQRFRFDVNIPKPAYMSFSDLVDQEGVY